MRLRVISDGTLKGTRVISERGEILRGVTSVEWRAAAGKAPTVRLEIEDVQVQLEGEREPTHTHVVCPICETACLVETSRIGRKADYVGTERQIKCLTCGKSSQGALWFDTSGMN